MTSSKSNWLAAACMTALSCAASMASAQDNGSDGIVRISDGRIPVQQAAFHGYHGGYGSAGVCPQPGGCPYCNCPGGGPYCMGGFFREHYCSNSPDHGYSPPAKYPLLRRGVQYNAYYPNQWYGTPGARYASGFPVVYQPTDTAQLGYSYQHVPFWQPNPAMMPQRPVPPNWNIVAPTVSASNYHGTRWVGYAPFSPYTPPFGGFGGYYGSYGNDGYPVYQDQGTPVNQAPQAQPTPVPQATPSPEASIPPIPRQFEDSAASGHIRRAAYE